MLPLIRRKLMSRILISLLVGYVPFLSEAARPKAITFDCAQTLLEVDLNPAGVVIQSAEELGCKIEDKERAAQVFQELFDSDKEIQESLNGAFNAKVAQARMRLWVNFAQRWAEKVGVPKGPIPLILAKAYRKIRDPGFERLKLYPETLSTLKKLKEQGYKLAVISNWGMNLKDVLDHFKLTPYFDVIIGSEEVRVEKPNPKIFQITLEKLQLQPQEVVHVGDTPEDDIKGAQSAGIRAILINRKAKESRSGTIRSLEELTTLFDSENKS